MPSTGAAGGQKNKGDAASRTRERVAWLCAQIVGDDVLELGCGDGRTAIAAAHHAERVVGVDSDAEGIENARSSILEQPPEIQRRLNFFVADPASTAPRVGPTDEPRFDTILVGESVWTLLDPTQVLLHGLSMLKTEGRIVASVPLATLPGAENEVAPLSPQFWQWIEETGTLLHLTLQDSRMGIVLSIGEASEDSALQGRPRSADYVETIEFYAPSAPDSLEAMRRERDDLRGRVSVLAENLETARRESLMLQRSPELTQKRQNRFVLGLGAFASTVNLEVKSGRIIRAPHTSARKTFARVRKALRRPTGPHTRGSATYSQSLLTHRLMPLVALSAQRPVGSKVIQDELSTTYWTRDLDLELSEVLDAMLEVPPLHSDAANLFVASVRALCERDLARGLSFSEKFLSSIPDKRAMRSLVTYFERSGNTTRAMGLLELIPDEEWVGKRRAALEKKAEMARADNSPEAHLCRYFGYQYLRSDPTPALLLYGDIDLNVIDGSSVWLASVAEALTGTGIKVYFLLKANIERSLLLEPLLGRKDIEILEPRVAGYECLKPQQAIRVIEALDGIMGGYRTIVLRGMDICRMAAGRRSLRQRVWAYLTDFYCIDGSGSGQLVLTEGARESFADFKHIFSRFLVQTPQIANVIHDEFDIREDMVLSLPPMIPDSVRWRDDCAKERGDGTTWRLAYAGKIAPQWGVLELISIAEQLKSQGHSIEVHLIGDKIHANSEDCPTFVEDVEEAIASSSLVTWHRGLARAETLELMCKMDLAWCYRDPSLERHTLELSTKLLECLAIQVPMVLTRNSINEDLLGEDYPLFVSQAAELFPLLQGLLDGAALPSLAGKRYADAVSTHRISSVRERDLAPTIRSFAPDASPRRIVLAGHDLKFVGEFESFLKRRGHIVRRDDWEWGQPQDLERSRHLGHWADTVFCEWSLANAVWYSENLSPEKRLVVRLHSQEIHKRAKVFPPKLNFSNVDQVVFVSDHIRNTAVERLGWQDKPLTTIPNYVNCALFDRPKRPSAAFTIGFVGCVPEMKRLDRALDFISALRKRDPRFTLILKGKLPQDYGWMQSRPSEMHYYDEQFDRIERDESLRDGVIFGGFSTQIAGWYREVGCVLSTSDFESFHYSVAEGAASGAMPIIWPWDGARDLFPAEWSVEDTDAAVERALQNLGDNWKGEQSTSLYQRPIRQRYDSPQIFERLAAAVLGDSPPTTEDGVA